MRAAASVSDTDMARMDDDGGTTAGASTSELPSGAVSHDWSRSLGASHARRDARARRDAEHLDAAHQAHERALRARWPAIVDAMRAVVDRYNRGAGGTSLTLFDQSIGSDRELAVDVTAADGRVLTLVVDEGDLWVRAGEDAGGVRQAERWIGSDRSDAAIAAYVLQHWMNQL